MRKGAAILLVAMACGLLVYGELARRGSVRLRARNPAANGPAVPSSQSRPTLMANKRALNPPPSVKAPASVFEEIAKTSQCYESQDCDFPKKDPKAYDLAVGQRLASQLRSALAQYRSSVAYHAQLRDLARSYLQNPDPFVQAAALEILGALPPSSDSLREIATAIEGSSDPALVEAALTEMKRYLGTADETFVHTTLANILRTGAHFSGQATAQGILPFINRQSYPIYLSTAEALNPADKTTRNLRSALDEYRRTIQGG